jgi:predicted Fe-S protein YdhL (DUF1289 family)
LNKIESPCISVCKIDPDSTFCTGCWRTRDEIKSWKESRDEVRLGILNRARERRESAGGKKCRPKNRGAKKRS